MQHMGHYLPDFLDNKKNLFENNEKTEFDH